MPNSVRLLAVAIILAGASARADDPFARGIDAVPLRLTPLANSGLQLEGAEPSLERVVAAPRAVGFNFGILGLKLGDLRLGDLIPFRGDLRIGGSYTLHDRIDLGAELPITVADINAFRLLEAQGFKQDAPRVVWAGAPRRELLAW